MRGRRMLPMVMAVLVGAVSGAQSGMACPSFETPAHDVFRRLHPVDASRVLAAAIRDGCPSVKIMAAVIAQDVTPPDPLCLAGVIREDPGCTPALEELRESGSPDVADAIAALVESAGPCDARGGWERSARALAVLVLGFSWDPGAHDALLDTLMDAALLDPDPEVRTAALASAAGEWGTRLAAVAWATRDPDPLVRLEACSSLGFAGDAAAPYLQDLAMALDDPDADVREAAAKALEELVDLDPSRAERRGTSPRPAEGVR